MVIAFINRYVCTIYYIHVCFLVTANAIPTVTGSTYEPEAASEDECFEGADVGFAQTLIRYTLADDASTYPI